jgi:hypothetical protein
VSLGKGGATVRVAATAGLLLVLVAGGCALEVRAENGAAVVEAGGLARAYVSVESLRPYSGTIFRLGIFDMAEHPAEIANIDVWPIGGAGIGLVGARVRVLMLGAGAGVLWYQPKPHVPPAPEPVDG